MLDVLLMIVAMAVGGGEGNQGAEMANDTAAPIPAETAEPAAAAPVVAEAEPQIATGKFTTATEVKPILTMTKGNWVAVREYDGHDLVYFTHLMSWRCGLSAMRYSLNDGPLQVYDLPPVMRPRPRQMRSPITGCRSQACRRSRWRRFMLRFSMMT